MRLYHGSSYKTYVLHPGFYYSKQLEQWDETESNEWLYASTHKDEAVLNGLASAIGKIALLNRMHYDDKEVVFYVEGKLTIKQVDSLVVYLYEIANLAKERWVKVGNTHNQSTTEYKTKEGVTPLSCIEVRDRYCGRKVRIISQDVPPALKW